MLINATQLEEVRVALVDGQKLYDLDIESPQQAVGFSPLFYNVPFYKKLGFEEVKTGSSLHICNYDIQD